MDAAYSTAAWQFNACEELADSDGKSSLQPAPEVARRPACRARCLGLVAWAGLVLSSGCGETFSGPPELVPAQLARSLDRLLPLAEGESIDLLPPIQGGYVLFVGAAVRNVSASGGSLLGELRRARASDGTPLSQPGAVLYSDERSVKLQPLPGDFAVPGGTSGWLLSAPNPNDTANISTCPNPLDLSIVDSELYLQLTYRDVAGRTATSTRKVVPRCAQADAMTQQDCRCQCEANYQPKKCLF